MKGAGKDVLRAPCSVKPDVRSDADNTEHGIRNTLTLRNRQHDRCLDLRFLRRILRHILSAPLATSHHELCFHFVTAEEMARVNWQFLQHEGSTDVITFDYVKGSAVSGQRSAKTPDARRQTPSPLSGEAFICVADAVKQAREFKTSWQSEVVRYAVHALLHLRGYDDLEPAKRREMKREENGLMRELAADFDLDQLETRNSKP